MLALLHYNLTGENGLAPPGVAVIEPQAKETRVRNKFRIISMITCVIATAAVISGCGGGGGGGTPPVPPGTFSLSGRVVDLNSGNGVAGARVTIGSYTSTSNNQGNISFSMAGAPGVNTYSVDLSSSVPAVYTWWVRANGTSQDPASVTYPAGLNSGGSLGNIYVVNKENAPPPPIIPF